MIVRGASMPWTWGGCAFCVPGGSMSPTPSQFSGAVAGGLTVSSSVLMPQAERLTVQREANDLNEALRKAHVLLDILTSAQSPSQGEVNAALMPLGAAVSASRSEATRLAERIDSLVQTVGQL